MRNSFCGNAFLAAISANRPNNVAPMQNLCGPLTWVVPKGQAKAYKEQGAASVLAVDDSCTGSHLAQSRNAALEAAFASNLACVQTDDDLQKCLHVPAGCAAPYKLHELTFYQTINYLLQAALSQNAKLAGVAPVSNAFYYSGKRYHTDKFIIGSLFATFPSNIRFNTSFRLKEDYDYTMQHLVQFGAVARCSFLMPRYKHYANAGGCQDYRNAEEEQRAAQRLMQMYPNAIFRNKRKEGEILLRWKAHAGCRQ